MNVAVMSHEMPRKTGIGRFQANTVPHLLEHPAVDPIFFQPNEWYPFSMTIETIIHNWRMTDTLDQYDRVFIPAQDRLTFDPRKIEADVIPYVHDIIHGTSTFQKNGYTGLKGQFGFYLSTLQELRSTRYNSWCDTVICNSEHVKRQLFQRTGFDGEAHVIYQGVELPDVEPEEQYSYDLVYTGSTIQRKNPNFLARCLNAAIDQGYTVATINGVDMGLPGDTYCAISEEKLAKIYASSRYYIHPSRDEGFGRCPVEAQSKACVPLALDMPVNHEILGQEGGSWYAIDTVEDVLQYLQQGRTGAVIDGAQHNAERFQWAETVRQLKEVLLA